MAMSFADQLRREIDGCGMSRYAICQRTEINQSTLSRFMAGKAGLTMDNLDKIAALLNLQIVASGKSKVKGAKVKHGKPK
jgi:DNA transposition AAA+ family ATPase